MGSCTDLRKYEDPASVEDAFAALVSGNKSGYKTIIERKKPTPRCSKCSKPASEDTKFCPECGGKIFIPMTNCPQCKKHIDETEKFCTNCGEKLK